MAEPHKARLMDRLRREGRWDEATAYRDQQRDRLRGEGVPKAEAREQAWLLMAEEFPPLPEPPAAPANTIETEAGAPGELSAEEADAIIERLGDSETDWPFVGNLGRQ